MKLVRLIEELEKLAPPCLCCDWDNVGLLVGDLDKNIKRVVITLDATDEVVDQAIKEKADLIISHHPLIFKGVKSVSSLDFTGRRVLKLAENKIALYAMHTNFDATAMAERASELLGLSNKTVLEVTVDTPQGKLGIGRVGVMKKQLTLDKMAELVKERFNLENVLVYGNLSDRIDIVAVCPGSGRSAIKYALQSGAQVLITGDIDHHSGIDAVARGLNIIDASHYGLEKIFVDFMAQFFDAYIPKVTVFKSVQEEPFKII